MKIGEPRPLLARLLQILHVLLNFFSNDRDKPSDPTVSLPEGFQHNPSIRQGRAKLWNTSLDEIYDGSLLPPKVQTELGDIEGYHMRVISGRYIYAFEAVPYAEAPIGDRRFSAPVPKQKWNGTLQAKSWGPPCVQVNRDAQATIIGNEDCLHLNIYTAMLPAKNKNSSLPTMIFIHGGTFTTGSSRDYGPSYLLQQDIVLVTFNYRLGPFGFFTDGTTSTSGNYGLKDQSMAIDFVHKHIDRFGGDPNNIILFGQSAGACATHFQIMSNYDTKYKIAGAISLSGTVFNPWALKPVSEIATISERVAILNDCRPEPGSKYMMACLRTKSAVEIMTTAVLSAASERVLFWPVIEPDFPGAFISSPPKTLYKLGKVAKIPYIFSTTSKELELGLALKLLGLGSIPVGALSLFWTLAPELLSYKGKVSNEYLTTKKIIRHYGGESFQASNPEVLGRIMSDRLLTHGIRKAIDLHSKIAPTYAEYFAYRHYMGYANDLNLNPHEFGTAHAENLPLLFNRTGVKPVERHHRDYSIVQLMSNLYTNFATFGEPIYTNDNYKDIRIWRNVDPNDDTINFLQIDKEVKMVTVPTFEKASYFWKSLNINDL